MPDTPLTDQQHADIRNSVPLGYEGPWVFDLADDERNWVVLYDTTSPSAGLIATVPDYGMYLAEFIAEARTAVPALLAELDRLRAERDQAREVARADSHKIDQLSAWAMNTKHGAAAAEVVLILNNGQTPAEPPDGDEWVRCSGLHCPNGERFRFAAERGWQHGHMDTWLCPTCAICTIAQEQPR